MLLDILLFSVSIVLQVLLEVCQVVDSSKINTVTCGVDHDADVLTGDVDIHQYPWYGILYYYYNGDEGETRAVAPVILIQEEFVIAAASDIAPMPKHNFRSNSRVLMGADWREAGRRVRNYVLHPEHEQTTSTLALIQLAKRIIDKKLKPACPPPERLVNPKFYAIKFHEDYDNLQKQVWPVEHVPGAMCKDFYVHANLYQKIMRPPHATCAISLADNSPCVWEAGAALVTRDVWGRWQLLGVGVRGPGCGAPSRYLDVMSYMPWIEQTLDQFRRITISKINNHKYVLRSGSKAIQRFGNCDEEEQINLVYREQINLWTDNNQYQFLTYNLTLNQEVEFTCLVLSLVNASASSEMSIKHYCTRVPYGPACYAYKGSLFDISVYILFSDTCKFVMAAWGYPKDLGMLDILEWKWEEGTYYEDFALEPTEYRGTSFDTQFGFEPLDHHIWVPDFDIWTTTEYDNSSTTTEMSRDILGEEAEASAGYWYQPTTTTPKPTKRKVPRKTTTTERSGGFWG